MNKYISITLMLLLTSCNIGGATASDYWTGGDIVTEEQQGDCGHG